MVSNSTGRYDLRNAMDDTDPKIHALQIQLYRQMTVSRKLELMEEEWLTLRELALAGIRRRLPGCSEPQALDELAKVLLGPELAAKVAGRRRG